VIEASASSPFEATLEGAPAGLIGTIAVRVTDPGTQTTVVARSSDGIVEYPAGSGVYAATIVAPEQPGSYTVLWDLGEPLAPGGVFTEDLRVYAGAPPAPAPAGLLASVEDVELYLRTTGTVSAGAPINPGLIEKMLRAASDRIVRAVPDRTLMPDGPRVRRVPFAGARGLVRVPDLREALEVRVDDRDPLPAGPPSGYGLRRIRVEDPALWVELYSFSGWGGRELIVNGYWGPEEVWPSVSEACVVWVARAYHQRTNRFADNAQGPDGLALGYFRNLPPDVKVVLSGLKVPGV
jgi:hypothetical protein